MTTLKVLRASINAVEVTDGTKTTVIDRNQLDYAIETEKIDIEALRINCLEKIKNKYGQISHYKLADKNGDTITVSAQNLKDKMINYKVIVSNLKLSKDGKILDSKSINKHKVATNKLMKQRTDAVYLDMDNVNENGIVIQTIDKNGFEQEVEKAKYLRSNGYTALYNMLLYRYKQ